MSVHLIPILPPTRVKYLRQISPTISRLSGQIKCHATLMPRSHHFPMLNETCAKPDYFAEEHVQKLSLHYQEKLSASIVQHLVGQDVLEEDLISRLAMQV